MWEFDRISKAVNQVVLLGPVGTVEAASHHSDRVYFSNRAYYIDNHSNLKSIDLSGTQSKIMSLDNDGFSYRLLLVDDSLLCYN